MGWDATLETIAARRARLRELARAKRADGALNVRARIEALVDPGSFEEVGPGAGSEDEDGVFAPANYALGFARVHGRLVVVGGEDFTARGGSPTPAGLRKSVYAEDLALETRAPLIRLHEGAGGSVAGAAGDRGKAKGPTGDAVFAPQRFLSVARTLGEIPVVSAALGAVAGLPAARFAAAHFRLMRADAQILVAGPAVVARALGASPDKEHLGGVGVHLRNGVAHNLAADDADATAQIRRFLGYMPDHARAWAPRATPREADAEARAGLASIVPQDRRKPYKMRRLLEGVLDKGSLMEIAPRYGAGVLTALGRLDGWPVGAFANDVYVNAGAMSAQAARKTANFVDMCATFHLPIITFVDEPGFMIGPDAERDGVIREGVGAIAAAMLCGLPWASVHVRKAFGVAAAAHFAPGGYVLAWPSAEQGPLPAEGGVAVAFRRQIAAAADPEAERAALEARMARAQASALAREESFAVHELIDPRATRTKLQSWLARAVRARDPAPSLHRAYMRP